MSNYIEGLDIELHPSRFGTWRMSIPKPKDAEHDSTHPRTLSTDQPTTKAKTVYVTRRCGMSRTGDV